MASLVRLAGRARLVSYWFDPRVCLVSSGSICVDHLIYALIAIADVGHGSDLSFDMGVENEFFGRGIEPGKGGSVCISAPGPQRAQGGAAGSRCSSNGAVWLWVITDSSSGWLARLTIE